jgi:hypothetical protein
MKGYERNDTFCIEATNTLLQDKTEKKFAKSIALSRKFG